MKPFKPGPAVAGGVDTDIFVLSGSVALAGCLRIADSLVVVASDGCLNSSGYGVISSPVGSAGLPLIVPRNFLKRDPSLDVDDVVPALWLIDVTEGDRKGIVSTLVDADTRRGVEIWLGAIFLRLMEPAYPKLAFPEADVLLRASIAASALRRTSRVRSSWLTISSAEVFDGGVVR